jgi:DNA helicase-2/ATP-dependent DNA helicase PcrA
LPDELEEERRLMFVGITRAKQELQISRAVYRDFRGQRKMTIPSRFLMELPRDEMEVVGHEDDVAHSAWTEPEFVVPPSAGIPPEGGTTNANFASPRRGSAAPLLTAAEMSNGGQSPPAAPDGFVQGMLVRHPQNGLGRVVALSGSGATRVATVDFTSPPCRMKFLLLGSPLRPVRPARSETA